MSLQDTPSAERLHIGFFGRMNAGKSALVNAVTGQPLSVVSATPGTTTDPVRKSMELLPLGPVVIIDTPGSDDSGALGDLRTGRTRQVLDESDLAVLVIDAARGPDGEDRRLLRLFEERRLPHLVAYSKVDLAPASVFENAPEGLRVSALTGEGVEELKRRIAALVKEDEMSRVLVRDLVPAGKTAVLVCPIDESAPKGRLILPQVLSIRDLLDGGAAACVTKETTLAETLRGLAEPPALVVTDSQVFPRVAELVPEEVPLTSFSILMARYKGYLETAVEGVRAIRSLRDGDRVLMAEGCTHHRQCNDIGTVKIPRWLRTHTQAEVEIETCSGRGFPENLAPYALVIHCGGCMLTERVVRTRMRRAVSQGVPFTNYGVAIAHMSGILGRSIRIFPELYARLYGEEVHN